MSEYKDVPRRIVDKLKDSFNYEPFKAVFDGDPGVIGQSQLPCVAVEVDSSDTNQGPTGFDKWRSQITIKIILDKRSDFGADSDDDLTARRLRDAIFARNDNEEFEPGTLMRVLRTDFTLDNAVLNQEININYGMDDRGTNPEQPLFTAEAHVTITVDEHVRVKNRS